MSGTLSTDQKAGILAEMSETGSLELGVSREGRVSRFTIRVPGLLFHRSDGETGPIEGRGASVDEAIESFWRLATGSSDGHLSRRNPQRVNFFLDRDGEVMTPQRLSL